MNCECILISCDDKTTKKNACPLQYAHSFCAWTYRCSLISQFPFTSSFHFALIRYTVTYRLLKRLSTFKWSSPILFSAPTFRLISFSIETRETVRRESKKQSLYKYSPKVIFSLANSVRISLSLCIVREKYEQTWRRPRLRQRRRRSHCCSSCCCGRYLQKS